MNRAVTRGEGHVADAPDQRGAPEERLGASLASGLFTVAGGLAGYLLSVWLLEPRGLLAGPNNLFYLTVVGALSAYLFTRGLARRVGRLWSLAMRRLSSVGPDAVVAGLVGATVGLVLTILVNTVLAEVPGFTWYWSILIALLAVTSCAGFFVANRRVLPGLRTAAAAARRPELPWHDKVLDSSALIDGRVVEVAEANFLDGRLLVPQFVLAELQRLADSDDPLRRQRGRRGLEVVDRLVAHVNVPAEVVTVEGDDPKTPVDARLVRYCQAEGKDLVTTDHNLSRVAALQGVRVLNVNQLANGVK
ncbi:MAG TPA: PIN domain-containing protein, partial [Trueperaceae bacterium]|nr:PIN domain-containing protein [Trueperaceae bacterium]